jgi:uncharacterized protein (TIGR00288 family)
MRENIAILWDVENVTPRYDTMFVTGLLEYASEKGKISVSTAYGDWTRGNLNKQFAEVLADNAFEMIHVPKSKKNSADITLITHAIELIFQYPHIKTIILVTGDADFRPLLLSLRKHGLQTIIICDSKSASEDLLMLADSYKDYRDLIPDTLDDDSDEEKDQNEQVALPFHEAVSLLKEAIQIMEKDKKAPLLGPLKVRLKLLNSDFDEKQLGCKTWKSFVLKAADHDPQIVLETTEKEVLVKLQHDTTAKTEQKIETPFIFLKLLEAIQQSSDNDSSKWLSYSLVAQMLKSNEIDIKQYQYSKMKKLMESAEKRGLVETKSAGLNWSVRLTKEGKKACSVFEG